MAWPNFLNQVVALEGIKLLTRYNQMVNQRYAQDISRLFDSCRYVLILRARGAVAGGMVMPDDDGGGVG